MADLVKGRRWPALVPFEHVRSGDGTHRTAAGFVCKPQPGDFRFTTLDGKPTADPLGDAGPDQLLRLDYRCPRTGEPCGGIIIGVRHKPQLGAVPTWSWDGNLEAPTLQPSINCLAQQDEAGDQVGGCGWHGWLRAGAFCV